jgi:exopolysaccharide biosynthesis polyprenyl glycosylphosphotransferase
MNKKARTRETVVLLINLCLIALISLIFYLFWFAYYHNLVYFYQKGNWLMYLLSFLCLCMFDSIYGGFKLGMSKTSDLILSQSISIVFTNFIITMVATFVNKGLIPLNGILWMTLAEIGATIVLVALANRLYFRLFSADKAVLLYEGEYRSFYAKMLKYQNRTFDIRKSVCVTGAVLSPENLKEYDCVIALNLTPENKERIAKFCYENTVRLYQVPDFYDVILSNASFLHAIDTPILQMNAYGPSQVSKIIKRLFDIVFSASLIIITSPLWLIIAIAIKLNDGGPVFYRQTRLTQYGRPFEIVKFRSMKLDAEKAGGAQFAKANDDRITSVGRVIRASRLDELPQLWNILKGDMSVVGPRPERPEIIAQKLKDLPEFNFRLKVKAGLTGFAQVYGKYNTDLKDKLLMDLMYIEDFSLLLDLKIILMTVKIIFVKESTEGM